MKKILITLFIIIVIATGFYAYKSFFSKPLGFESEAECTEKTGRNCVFECGGPVTFNDKAQGNACNFAKWTPKTN